METKLTKWYAMTSHVITYLSTELLFGMHTFNFNCFFDDFNCLFMQINCLSWLLIYSMDLCHCLYGFMQLILWIYVMDFMEFIEGNYVIDLMDLCYLFYGFMSLIQWIYAIASMDLCN